MMPCVMWESQGLCSVHRYSLSGSVLKASSNFDLVMMVVWAMECLGIKPSAQPPSSKPIPAKPSPPGPPLPLEHHPHPLPPSCRRLLQPPQHFHPSRPLPLAPRPNKSQPLRRPPLHNPHPLPHHPPPQLHRIPGSRRLLCRPSKRSPRPNIPLASVCSRLCHVPRRRDGSVPQFCDAAVPICDVVAAAGGYPRPGGRAGGITRRRLHLRGHSPAR